MGDLLRSARAAVKMALFALLTLVIIPPQMLIMLFHRGRGAYIVPMLWHRGVCLIFGIRFQIEGAPLHKGQTLFMSNHLSYLDIPVIGSLLVASFVAKKEVEGWPVFGFLSKLQQTAFIDRRRSAISEEKAAIDDRLSDGRSIILFPEGTSTDGRAVLPFKSSLFALALDSTNPDLCIQPMTVRLDSVDGRPPLTQADRDLYAWHRDMDTELPVHLWLFARTSGARVTLVFHPALRASGYTDRTVLAKPCHDAVSNGLHARPALLQAA